MTEGVNVRKFLRAKRWQTILLGLLLACLLTLGLLGVRTCATAGWATWDALWADLMAEYITYGYVACSTLLVALGLGYVLGGRAERLEQLSLTDPLTHLANRRAFLAVLRDELQRAQRYKNALTLMLLDVDAFKQVNDSHGHEIGDRALQCVADSLRTTCRATDFVARLGGDEFVVILPFTTAVEAYGLANRIRAKLRLLSTPEPLLAPPKVAAGQAAAYQASSSATAHVGGPLALSIGLADLSSLAPLAPRSTASVREALMTAADAALYKAKEAGRDQAQPVPPMRTPPDDSIPEKIDDKISA